ncbi:MAG TPA: hypothetical protein V6D12_18525 [Candidatus Obscuribacterales bacterium]
MAKRIRSKIYPRKKGRSPLMLLLLLLGWSIFLTWGMAIAIN